MKLVSEGVSGSRLRLVVVSGVQTSTSIRMLLIHKILVMLCGVGGIVDNRRREGVVWVWVSKQPVSATDCQFYFGMQELLGEYF